MPYTTAVYAVAGPDGPGEVDLIHWHRCEIAEGRWCIDVRSENTGELVYAATVDVDDEDARAGFVASTAAHFAITEEEVTAALEHAKLSAAPGTEERFNLNVAELNAPGFEGRRWMVSVSRVDTGDRIHGAIFLDIDDEAECAKFAAAVAAHANTSGDEIADALRMAVAAWWAEYGAEAGNQHRPPQADALMGAIDVVPEPRKSSGRANRKGRPS